MQFSPQRGNEMESASSYDMAPLAPALRAEPLGDAIKRPPVRIRLPNAKRPDRVRVHIANRLVRLRCEEEEQRSDAMFAASVIYCAANGASAVCSDEVTGFEPAACRLRPASRRRYGPTRSCPSGRTARGCHQEAVGSNKTPKCKKARPHKRSGLFGPSVHNGLRKTRPNTGRRASIFKHSKVQFRTFDCYTSADYNGATTMKEVPNMTKVKRLTLDRYEHGLLVRALYEEWHRMMAEGKPTEDIEDLILKVIDAPAKKQLWRA